MKDVELQNRVRPEGNEAIYNISLKVLEFFFYFLGGLGGVRYKIFIVLVLENYTIKYMESFKTLIKRKCRKPILGYLLLFCLACL